MYSETVHRKQLIPWLTAALIPVTLQLGAGCGWVSALLITGICSLLVAWVWKKGVFIRNPILATTQCIMIVLVLAQLLSASADAWPGDNYPVVPLILLALCVWTCRKGALVAARVGCILFWGVLILYPMVMLLGIGQVKLSWLHPCVVEIPWETAVLLLLPAAAGILCDKQRQWSAGMLLPGIVYVAGTVIVAGILSPMLAHDTNEAFYTMSRSISIHGIAQRFDAVISAGMTVGWYALICLLLSLSAAWAEYINPQIGKVGVWMTAVLAGTGMLCNLHISSWILLILVAVFWVIIPILTQGLVHEKKS